MAGLLRGEVRWCDFGGEVGHELSGRRYGLVLSDAQFNHRFRMAVVAPVTSSRPVPPHRWHIPVGPESAWAVVSQLRSVAVSRLNNSLLGMASSYQMDDVALAVNRLLSRTSPMTGSGSVVPGDVYRARIPGFHPGEYLGYVLVLDYNPGNCMALVMVVSVGEVGNSRLKAPFQLGGDELWVALLHQVRTIFGSRLRERLGAVSLDVVKRVKAGFGFIVS